MRPVLKALRREPCREHPITDNERESFSQFTHLQRYYPALDIFNIPDTVLSHKHMELPTKYHINQWMEQDAERPKFWKAMRVIPPKDDMPDGNASDALIDSLEPCDVFTKVVHLLNPIDMLKEKYVCPEHPLVPQSENTWKHTLQKLHSHNNQAYVDAVANVVLSRFRELNLTPHCILSYGSFTAISKSYQFVISNEYDSFRQCRWFWNGMKSHSAHLKVIHADGGMDVAELPEYEELYKEITTCPFDNEEDENLPSLELADTLSETESVQSVTFDNIEEDAENALDILNIHNKVRGLSISSDKDLSVHSSEDIEEVEGLEGSEDSEESDGSEESEESEGSEESDDLDIDIALEIPDMPVIVIAQEAQEGVMDALMDEDDLDGCERDSQGWESRWTAWIFQVVATLSFLQSVICFTHNDLHSNNILWRTTKIKFLYYKGKDGTVWRVPTYGKIFSIIDFGRSIFRLGKRLWVSDDHWPDQDAGDQYNFGPFFDPSKPKVKPNPSFDLCRLSVSLIDGLFDEPPAKRKGKAVPIMSEDGSWKVYETKSHLYNLLWSWTVNDAGCSVYEDKDGNEKYEGFDLYIRIAHDVHGAVPKDQLHKPIFQPFIWKNKVADNEVLYPLGV
jgi:hypothetical protein